MENISVSRAKQFKSCKLAYKYIYEDKFVPTIKAPADVTNKGLVMHETFEALTHYENYNEPVVDANGKQNWGEPVKAYRQAPLPTIMSAFQHAMEENKLPIAVAEKYNLKRGLKRWLSFKHDYLDPRGTTLYAEKKYVLPIFGNTKTTAILDLLEDMGDGTYVIYDYKTPSKANPSNYKFQLMVYAYLMATVKGLIQPDSTDYQTVAKHFKCYIFFPLCDGEHEDYKDSLKQLKFTAKDVEKAIEDLKADCASIDAFDFNKPAEALQPTTASTKGPCGWCDYCGAKPQPEIGFEGCPITAFIGCMQKSTFMRPENWVDPKAPKAN